MSDVRLTHIGGPTVADRGRRLAAADRPDVRRRPAGTYNFGWGTSSRKLAGPAIAAADLGPIDAVLLSHDHHGDNLDDAGRALLPSRRARRHHRAGRAAARRQRARARAVGDHALEAPGRPAIEITATPCRHGPPLSHPIVGDVIGFALRWDGQGTACCGSPATPCSTTACARSPSGCDVDTALLHLGGVQFPVTGPVRYTMTARDAVELCGLRPPAHARSRSTTRAGRTSGEGRDAIERELAGAPEDIRRRFFWLTPGRPETLPVDMGGHADGAGEVTPEGLG